MTVPSPAIVSGPLGVEVRVTSAATTGAPARVSLSSTFAVSAMPPAACAGSASSTALMVAVALTVTVMVALSQLPGLAVSQIW